MQQIKSSWLNWMNLRWLISICHLCDWSHQCDAQPDLVLVQLEENLPGDERKDLQGGPNKWFGSLSESNMWPGFHSSGEMEETAGANRGAALPEKKPTTSAFDPAAVAQMCSPISHLYPSFSLQVIDGKLAPYLSKVIKFASSHVFSCSLCRQKGFICELCHNGQVIYPFQESAIKRYSLTFICFLFHIY